MTATVFSAETRHEAWVSATEHLLANGDALNVILDIAKPAAEGEAGPKVRRMLDTLYLREHQAPLHTVAETIFPAWEYLHRGARGVYFNYQAQYRILMQRRPPPWGTYANRLISRKDRAGNEINPLDRLVGKMRKVRSGEVARYRSSYELGMADEPYEQALYDVAEDGNRWRGGPCLMHLSFKLIGDDVHLTALYRNHDYRYKVPGNLLGLARLQAFVANEVDARIGSLVVHSTLASIGQGGSKSALKELLKRVEEVLDGRE